MSFKIIADTFSVARDSEHFVQIKTIKKPRAEEQVWLTIEINGETKYARSIAQGIIDTVEEVFFENSGEMSVYERFENTLKEINLIIKNLKEKRGPKALGEISAILAVFTSSELHLTQSKRAEAYLIRRGKLSMISEGLGGKSDDLFVNIATGELMPDDKIIFATSRLLRLAAHSQLVQILSDGVTEAVEALRELVMSESELSLGVACMHIKLPQRAGVSAVPLAAGSWLSFLQPFKPWLEKVSGFLNAKTKKLPLPKKRELPFNLSRRGILITLMGAVLVLVLSVSILVESRRNQALRNEYRKRIEALNQDLQVATTKGYGNEKETANNILDQVERESRDILNANFFRDEVMILLEKAQTTRDNINNTLRLQDSKPYVDLGLKKENVKALGMLNLNENFFAFEYNTLFEIILDQVLDPKTIDETEVVTAGVTMEDQDLLLFLTQSGRILEYAEGRFSFANTEDATWQAGVDLAAYGRNLYLLSPEKNQIYKYSRLRSNFSSASEYSSEVSLEGAISLTIDGNIYVLKKGGEIIKLFKSKPEAFEIDDLAVDISNVSQIFTSLELNRLYLLDPVNERVVMVEKDNNGVAQYVGQVVFEDLPPVNDFFVDKNEDKLFLLTDQEIYQVDLK